MKDKNQLIKEEKLKALYESIENKHKYLTARGILLVCNDISEISSELLEQKVEILNIENLSKLVLECRIKRNPTSFNIVNKMFSDYLIRNNNKKRKHHDEFSSNINKYGDKLRFYSYKELSTRHLLSIYDSDSKKAFVRSVGYFLIIVAPNFDLSKIKYRDRTNVCKTTFYQSIFEDIYYSIPQ